jgi:hypothetical protein
LTWVIGVLLEFAAKAHSKFSTNVLTNQVWKKPPMSLPDYCNVEFHCHTIFSKDSLTRPENLVKVCRRKGIDRVIVTDHNTIAGARAAQALDPDRVIVGEEIMTTRGEILHRLCARRLPKG